MNILLTGMPHAGKTTLLSGVIEPYNNRQGFVTQEITDATNTGQRLGFKLIDAAKHEAVLAHIAIESNIRVSKYKVDINALENFVKPLLTFGPDDLLYTDEIGQMQLYSNHFKDLVMQYLDAKNNFIGTLTTVYSDDFVEQIKARQDVSIIEVTPQNRDDLITKLKF